MEVKARAPGKIILTGEHAVVHGSTAVAASIDRYTYASLRFPTDESNDRLTFELKDMMLEYSWPVQRVKQALFDLVNPLPSFPNSCSPQVVDSINHLVEEQNVPEGNMGLAGGMSAFLWLYTSIQGFKPCIVAITSELPLGSGLGSSAAFCVSLSAALLASMDSVNIDRSHQGWYSYGDNELELVNKWAFEGEKIIHGSPSGIDNTVSTYGSMIKFKSGGLTRIKTAMALIMLITNTKVERNTRALVASVSERTVKHPDTMAAVFKAVDSISEELSSILQSPVSDEISVTENEEKLRELIVMNQGLLQCMSVSHTSIETVLQTTSKYKLASKLTGAGGGGCVLTLLPNLLPGTIVDKVTAELESCGFQCFATKIGGNGVEILFENA